MGLSKFLRDYSRTIAGKEQLIIAAVAKALEVVPRQLCENAGFDSTNILNRLRQMHSQGLPSLHFLTSYPLSSSTCFPPYSSPPHHYTQVTNGMVLTLQRKMLQTTLRPVSGSLPSSRAMPSLGLQRQLLSSCQWMRPSATPNQVAISHPVHCHGRGGGSLQGCRTSPPSDGLLLTATMCVCSRAAFIMLYKFYGLHTQLG